MSFEWCSECETPDACEKRDGCLGNTKQHREIAHLRAALSKIESARPQYYQRCFEDHAAFAQRLKAMARAALQPPT